MLTAFRHRVSSVAAGAVVSLAAFVAAPAVHAGDFQPKRVSADAKWLAYINVDGVLHSTLGKFFVEHGEELGLEINAGDIDEIKQQIGIDPMHDLHSLTAYGSGNPEEGGHFVVVLETSAAIDDAVKQLAGEAAKGDNKQDDKKADGDDITQVDINGQKVHVFSDGGETTFFQIRPGPTSADRLVIVSMDREWMAKGLGVLDGKAASLDRAEKPTLTVKPVEGTLMFASMNDMSLIDMGDGGDGNPGSAIVKGAKGVDASFGENGSDTFLNLRLTTASPDDATNLSDIVRGLVALGRLAGSKEPDLKPAMAMMNSLKLTTDGAAIALSFTHATQDLIDTLKAVAAADAKDEDKDKESGKGELKVEVHLGGDGKSSKDKAKDKND